MGRKAPWLEVGELGRGVGAAVVGELEEIDAVAAEVGRGHRVLERVGDMVSGEELDPAVLRLSGIEAGEDAGRTGRGEEDAAGEDVVDPLAAGSIGHETLPPGVEGVAPRVDEALHVDLGPARLGTVVPHAAAKKSPHAVGRLEVGVDVDRLVHPEHALGSPAEGMDEVVGVLGAEA
jgi:hypothetical protein